MLSNKLVVSDIDEGSPAEEYGLEKGDTVLRCNKRRVYYDLDFAFLEQVSRLKLDVIRDGSSIEKIIKKDKYETCGLHFRIPVSTCRNNCIFCFVDQMPSNMRKSLYIKDEDIRQSFLFGSYITASEMDEETAEYLRLYKTYPVYISIHAVNQEIREQILGRKEKVPILDKMKMLKRKKIIFHGQVVLVPGLNDRECLDESIGKLSSLYPYLRSLSVVPVGLTRYREGLFPLEGYGSSEAAGVYRQVKRWQNLLKKNLGTRFVFLADEFYLKAGKQFPGMENYEDFSQLSNGVGLIRIFIDDFNKRMYSIESKAKAGVKCRKICLLTGLGFYPVLCRLIRKWNLRFEDDIGIIGVKNWFFGESVDVAGLLAWEDLQEYAEHKKDTMFLIPDIVLNDDYFTIDNISGYDIEEGCENARFIKSDAESLISRLKIRLVR